MRTRDLFFHGSFYGLKIFWCKTAQFCEKQRESICVHFPLKDTLRNIAKNCAKSR